MKMTRPPEPPPEKTEASIISIIPTKIMMKAARKTVNPIGHPTLRSSVRSLLKVIGTLLEQS
jgi:hypothetical protein